MTIICKSKYKKLVYWPIWIVLSNVSSIGPLSERKKIYPRRRVNARNIRLHYPYLQNTNLVIFRFVSLLFGSYAGHYVSCDKTRVISLIRAQLYQDKPLCGEDYDTINDKIFNMELFLLPLPPILPVLLSTLLPSSHPSVLMFQCSITN